ncbi:MAG: hypothetical protein ACD_50C00334G0001 [uncultured bacterium]|nr:MAG: hypothetical protein ACD_50C00334G0001 [uncultured bacterium]
MDKQTVVLPDASGPKISTILPLGTPPTPSAKSKGRQPVEITEISNFFPASPKRIIEPLPYCFSICSIASLTASSFCDASVGPFGSLVF